MSDLISRSELIKVLKDRATNEAIMGYMTAYDVTNSIIDEVEEQPTAYDIDNVANAVEEITKRILNNCDEIELDWPEEERTGYDMNEDILKIRHLVKHGCIETDDVCEWKLSDTKKLMPYKTSCGNEDLHDNSYKYCPYCGKKIRWWLNNG